MKVARVSMTVLAPLALVFAQNVVDSISYGDNTAEWQIYATDGQVNAFAVQGGQLWYATDGQVATMPVKKGRKDLLQKLGAMSAAGITAMCTDCTGVLWMGGPQGVALSADGKTFKTFTKESGLVDDGVTKIFPTKRGIVWVGSENGLSAYRDGAWKTFTTSDGLCGNSIRDITIDGKGTVWFGTNKGIATYNGSAWGKHDMKNGMSWNDVNALAFDTRKEVIWAAVGKEDINAYNGKEWEVFMAIQEGVMCIMADTQSRIWFGSSAGLVKYNGFEWVYDQQTIGIPAAVVKAMRRDDRGDLWFGIDTGVLHMNNPYPF